MFYSRTFLARKSPLGTIWIAAHLAYRIKRPQIEGIHIPSFAEKIMMPDVPIALRLSGHLLFGLVRIYSWKVNHLFSDCNKIVTDMKKAFASVPVDLPIEADHAPFEVVTLPETFDLDALELDDAQNTANLPDKYLKPYSQITLLGQFPMEGEQYVALSVTEDTVLNPSPWRSNRLNLSPEPGNALNPSPRSINELNLSPQSATIPPVSRQLDEELPPFENVFESARSSPERATVTDIALNSTTLETPSVEKMLDDTIHRPQDVTPFDAHTDGQLSHTISRRRNLFTIPEGMTVTEVGSSGQPELQGNTSEIRLNFPDLEASSVKPPAAVNPEPAPPVKREPMKKRRRRQDFDKQLVLNNMKMKRQLDDSSRIVCKRRKLPCSKLDVWKHFKFIRKGELLDGPLFPGMSSILMEVSAKTYPHAPKDATLERSFHDKETEHMAVEAQMATPMRDAYIEEIERARDADNVEDLIPQFAAADGSDFGLNFPREQNSETGFKQATGIPSPAEPLGLGVKTPPFHFEELRLAEDEVPEAPGLLDSSGDLNILDIDGATQGHLDAFEVESMSARTRAVAKYFKDNTLLDQLDSSGHISLNRILEQRNRKQCSRLFFETLVLKSNGYISVEQKEPYGDIFVSPTPALQSAKF